MSLKIENSRHVAKPRPVCMDLCTYTHDSDRPLKLPNHKIAGIKDLYAFSFMRMCYKNFKNRIRCKQKNPLFSRQCEPRFGRQFHIKL